MEWSRVGFKHLEDSVRSLVPVPGKSRVGIR